MAKRKVFYSFHFENDVFRVQQIRNMGVIDGNEPVSPNTWEEAKKKDGGVEKWINDTMNNCSCIIVLVGSQTSTRPWVDYEIRKAWNDKKGLFGIYIHNLKDPRTANSYPSYGKCNQGQNPFDSITFTNGNKLSTVVKCYNPSSTDAYNDIKNNITNWIESAIENRK